MSGSEERVREVLDRYASDLAAAGYEVVDELRAPHASVGAREGTQARFEVRSAGRSGFVLVLVPEHRKRPTVLATSVLELTHRRPAPPGPGPDRAFTSNATLRTLTEARSRVPDGVVDEVLSRTSSFGSVHPALDGDLGHGPPDPSPSLAPLTELADGAPVEWFLLHHGDLL